MGMPSGPAMKPAVPGDLDGIHWLPDLEEICWVIYFGQLEKLRFGQGCITPYMSGSILSGNLTAINMFQNICGPK